MIRDDNPYQSYKRRQQKQYGPWQVVHDQDTGVIVGVCKKHINEETMDLVMDDEDCPALADECQQCFIEQTKQMREETRTELKRLLGERQWNDYCRNDVPTKPFEDEHKIHWNTEESISIGVYNHIPERFSTYVDLDEFLSYMIEQGVGHAESIGQDGYFSMSDVKQQIENAEYIAELMEKAAKDWRGLHDYLRTVYE
jgi:hypothetical protein